MTDLPSIQGWFDFSNLYDQMAATVPRNGVIVELGVWKGASLCYLAAKLIELQRDDVRLYGVDRWDHREWDGYQAIINCDKAHGEHRSVYQQCKANLHQAGVEERVGLIKSDSILAATLFANASVDFVFMDDTHDSDHIKKEIAAWLPKMRRPTWMAGHDYPGDIKEGVLFHFPNARVDHASWIADLP